MSHDCILYNYFFQRALARRFTLITIKKCRYETQDKKKLEVENSTLQAIVSQLRVELEEVKKERSRTIVTENNHDNLNISEVGELIELVLSTYRLG